VSQLAALLRAMRPAQWSKNLLLFAGALFSRTIFDPDIAGRAVAGFAAFCLLSGAVYLINDLRDLEADRLHPSKRHRPLASGKLGVGTSRIAVIFLLLATGVISAQLGPTFSMTAAAYLLVNLLYSTWLKRIVLVDVFAVALGFVLRATAGVELIRPVIPDVTLSPWLLVCTFFLALFLGFGKRRQEIVIHQRRSGDQRAVLKQYSVELLDAFTLVCAATTLVAYAIYTIWPETIAKVHSQGLLFTIPFVAFGIFRYMWLVRFEDEGEDPSMVLVQDRPLLIDIFLWGVAVALVLYLS
jgi:4-hydroxybenzoate polyprenyltransferase